MLHNNFVYNRNLNSLIKIKTKVLENIFTYDKGTLFRLFKEIL